MEHLASIWKIVIGGEAKMSNQGMQNNFIYFYDAANNTIKKETYDIEKLKSVNEFGKQIKLKINFNNGQNNIIFLLGAVMALILILWAITILYLLEMG